MRFFALGSLLLLFGAECALAQEGRDHAKKRWEWFYQQRAYPFATIPVGALANARSQLRSSQSLLRASNSSAPPPIAGTTWDALGPTLIGVRDIGRISTIAVHPTNANILYIGGAQGGVWRTQDKGTSWTPLTDKQCSLAMGSIAIDPVNPGIVYAATGEQHFSGDSYYGCGVLRSTDGGGTWTQTGATQFMGTAHNSRISRVVVVPAGAGTVATTTLFASADNGLWKSADGGATWTLARSGYYTDVIVADNAGQIVYAAQYGTGVFKSTDGGSTWLPLGTGFAPDSIGRINIAISKSSPTVLIATIGNGLNSSLFRGMWKTTDGALTWTKLAATGGATCASQCWYDMLIAIHPTEPSTVYFGGVSLYKSLDGGASFSLANTGLHADKHYLTFDPQDATRIYIATDGGLFKSDNAGASWENLNAGLGITQFYPGIALHPTDPFTIMGGTQDNGTLITTGSLNWTAAMGGDGGWAAIDYEDPLIRYAEFQWPFGPFRTNNGVSYSSKSVGINLADNAAFIPPLVMDPTDPKVLYFGTTKVYRTNDRAESWTPISASFTGVVTSIAPAPSNPNVVYATTSNGQLQVTTNLATWTPSAGLPALRAFTDVAVDRLDANTAYMTVSGFGTGHVFRTVNGGTSWTNASGNLPDMPVNAVTLDPVSRGHVMVGTDLGVFISTDSGTTWTVIDNGMPNVAVFDIAYNPNTGSLIAATHGRGMFKLQLNRPLTLVASPTRRRNDILEGSTTAIPDSANVILSGTGAGAAGWTATHTAAPWLSFTTASGTSTGKVRWSRNPTGLAPGLLVDTITVTVAGALDSPTLIYDTLNVISLNPAISLNVAQRGATLSAGIPGPAPVTDSAQVTVTGGNPNLAWTVAAKFGTWLKLAATSGNGTGKVRWGRLTDTLKAGTYFDTITVTSAGAAGSPATIADSLIVTMAAQLGLVSRVDTVISGTAAPTNATVSLAILGDPGSAAWTVTHRSAATWTSLTTVNGAGSGTIQWSKSSANLAPGTYYDTITVNVSGVGLKKLPDHFVVLAPFLLRSCAVDHFFGTSCLDATQLKYLDLTGNNDGQFNLGDFLSYLARTPASGAPPSVRSKP